MTLYFRNYLIAATALASINASAAQPVMATQSYPTKPVRFIVGFAPGGATDIIARALAQKLSDAFGQQVVVDNRAGGGGTIAAMMAAKSPPDGYTMLMGTISTLATNVSTYKNLPYDPLKDFAPVTLAAATPYFVTVNASLPSTLKDFIALAKAKPGSMNFGSSGAGGGAVTGPSGSGGFGMGYSPVQAPFALPGRTAGAGAGRVTGTSAVGAGGVSSACAGSASSTPATRAQAGNRAFMFAPRKAIPALPRP